MFTQESSNDLDNVIYPNNNTKTNVISGHSSFYDKEDTKTERIIRHPATGFLIQYHPILLIALGDAVWQACAQWVDPRLDKHHPVVGNHDFLTVDMMAILYPVVIGLMVYAFATGINQLKQKRIEHKPVEATQYHQPSPAQLGIITALGIYGWTAGYYLASSNLLGLVEKEWSPNPADLGDWNNILTVGAMVGVGSALVLGIYRYVMQRQTNDGLTQKQRALIELSHFACTFTAGMIWYLSFCSSDFGIGSHVGGDQHTWHQVSRALFAPLFTFIGTGAMLYAHEHKVTPYIKGLFKA